MNKLHLIIIILIGITPFIASTKFSYNYLDQGSSVISGGNYSINVNNSNYWDGHSWSEVSLWLYNQTLGAMNYADVTFLKLTGGTMGGNINMGNNNISNINYLKFNISDCENIDATAEGTICWNFEKHTLNMVTGLGNIVQIAQEDFQTVKNSAGQTIYAGQIVAIANSSGEMPLAYLANANASSPQLHNLGMVTIPSCNANAQCVITIQGEVHDLDTTGFANGTELYLSTDGSGNVTDISPDYPNYRIHIGTVLRSHANTGIILFKKEFDFDDRITINKLGVIQNLTAPNVCYSNGTNCVSSGSGGNPFNQVLNTTSNVSFGSVNITNLYFKDNNLTIDNSNIATPLIYGRFDSNYVTINGDLNATGDIGVGDDLVVGDDVTIKGDILNMSKATSTSGFALHSNVLPQFTIAYAAAPTFNLTVSSQGYFNLNAPTGTNQYIFYRNGASQFKITDSGNVDIGNANANLTFGGFTGAAKLSFQEVRNKIINLYQNANFHYGFGIPTIAGGYALRTYMPDSATNRFDWSFLSTADGTTDSVRMWLNRTELYVNTTTRINNNLIVSGNISKQTYYAQAYYHNYDVPVTINLAVTDTYYPINNFTMNGNYGFVVSGNGVNTTKSGLYNIDLRMAVQGLNNGDYELDLFINDTEIDRCSTFVTTSTGFHQPVSFGCVEYINAGSNLMVQVKDKGSPAQDLDYHSLNFRIHEI